MPYNSVIDRTASASLIPENVANEILTGAVEASSVMTLGRKLPNMSRKQTRMPVLSVMPTAYFVTGDTGLKQTTNVSWDNKYLDAEELAVIVPVPEAVIDDTDYDIWGEVRPLLMQAFGKAFDQAVLFGTNAPAAWPDDLLTAATAASHAVDLSTQIAANQDLYDILLGEGGTISKVEEDGFIVNGHIGDLSMRAKLRGLRDDGGNGQPIFMRALDNGQNMQSSGRYELDGEPIIFPRNGAMLPASALLFSGDWTQLVWAYRQDITFKILDQAVIQDNNGAIVYNLAQQDMLALRAVMRVAWQVPNIVNSVNTNNATRYPFSVLVP